MTIDEMRALAEQCISHPASRTTGDIERAGMAIIELLERVKAWEDDKVRKLLWKSLHELAGGAKQEYGAYRFHGR